MESKKRTSFLSRIISIMSIFMLVFGNNFFVFSDYIYEEKVLEKSTVKSTSISNGSFEIKRNSEEGDIFGNHDHDHEHNHENIGENNFGNTTLFSEPLVGEEIEIEGILEKLIGEGPNGYIEETYLVYDDSYGKTFTVDMNNIIDDSYVGSRVVLYGIDGNVFKTTQLLSNQSILAANMAVAEFTPESKNVRNVAIFMVKVSGHNTIWTDETSETKIFGETNSAKEYFNEVSYGELEINSDADEDGENDVFGPFVVDGAGQCEYSTWRSQAVQQAKDLGIDTSIYHNIILILPSYSKIGCSWAGLGNVGSVNAQYTTYSWIAYSSNSVVQHELGHNFGMGHSSTDPDNNGTVNSEYGDQSGVMGGPAGMPLKIGVNAPHMDQLNWGDHVDGYYEFANEPINNYILQPLQSDPTTVEGTRVVKFPKKNNNEYYYVSYRQPVGYNAQMYSKYQPGLMIHTYRGSGYSNTKLVKTLNNGEEFFDATNNIRITSQGIDQETNGMKVLIETNPGACVKGELGAFKLAGDNVFQTDEEGKIDFRIINNDVDCDKQRIDFTVNQSNQINGIFSPTSLDLHPQDLKDTSFTFNTGNQDGEKEYSFTARDNDGITPDHGSFTFTGTIMIDGTAPSGINNLSYNKVGSDYNFTFSESIDNLSGINRYEVHRNTGSGYVFHRNAYGSEESNIIGFTDTGLGSLKYDYKVIVIDNAGNKSVDSNIVTIDNTQGVCIFNGGELSFNSRFISTNTGTTHNLEYSLENKNINCNQTNFILNVGNTNGFTNILDKTNISLNSGETSTGILQVQTSNIPGEYQVSVSNSSSDYTQGNKVITEETLVNFYLEGEYISAPKLLEYTQNGSSYNFTWSGSTYISVGGEGNTGSNGNEKENTVIYEVYRSNSNNFNDFNLVFTGTTTNFTDNLIEENQYKYYVVGTNGKGLISEESNIVDINYNLPVNITGTLVFKNGSFVNNRNAQIELLASTFPVNYVLTGDVSQTGSIASAEELTVLLSENDGLKSLSVQYFSVNGKSNVINSSTTLDTNSPVINLITDITGSGFTQSSILLEGTISDTSGINNLIINGNNIGVNNGNWNTNVNLNIGANNINYSALDNAGNSLTGIFIINRVNIPENEDFIPDDFNFTIKNNAQLNREYTSNSVMITGINTGSTVTINNGMYRINQNSFTSATGVIFNNNSIEIKGLSSSNYSESSIVNINIGGISKDFVINTKSKSTGGGGGGGGGKRKPKVLCTVEEHLVCESNRKGVFKYYKKPGAVCVRGDLGKICNETEHEEDEEEKEYSDLKKLLLSDASDLNNNHIDDILDQIPNLNLNEEFEYKKLEDYSDIQIKKLYSINNSKFSKLKTTIRNVKYLSEDFNKYLYYLEINNNELNNILTLLEKSREEKNRLNILKYYNEYKSIKLNIKSINGLLSDIGKIKYKDISNNNNLAYFKYKDKAIRKKQTILSIKMKRKEFNIDLFTDINLYLHNEYENMMNGQEGDIDNIEYKKLLDRIKNL